MDQERDRRHDYDDGKWRNRVEERLDAILQEVRKVAISQDQFDQDLAPVLAAETANGVAVAALVVAVDAALAAKPAADLTAEDQAVQAAAADAATTAQALADELAKLNPAPPAPTP